MQLHVRRSQLETDVDVTYVCEACDVELDAVVRSFGWSNWPSFIGDDDDAKVRTEQNAIARANDTLMFVPCPKCGHRPSGRREVVFATLARHAAGAAAAGLAMAFVAWVKGTDDATLVWSSSGVALLVALLLGYRLLAWRWQPWADARGRTVFAELPRTRAPEERRPSEQRRADDTELRATKKKVLYAALASVVVGVPLAVAIEMANRPPVRTARCATCGMDDLAIEYAGDGDAFAGVERTSIARIAKAAIADVRPLLPGLPSSIVLKVRTGTDVIEETGETATAIPPNVVDWTIDPSRKLLHVIETQLRATLFHELHHLVRDAAVPRRSLMDAAVSEGMATAFERDFGGGVVPWGQAPDDVEQWAFELMALPPDAPQDHWMFRHPDGRRWIGFRVGTYLVDRASRALGRTSAELVAMPTEEIVRHSGVAAPPPP